ncbi:MAG: type ISP restriction/modification enzyme [Planktothrix agardhii]
MLIQHLLTERIFRQIFNNPDFTRRNIIAVEIEKVIQALTSKSFSRDNFLGEVDYFYRALEDAAQTIDEFSDKQHFLNTVYEKFFQGFAVKVADTHGIVYTPQPIVNFMVKSVEDILQKEFGKSLNDKGVHILDPFVGTGNFILRVMQEIKKTALPYKYEKDKTQIIYNEFLTLSGIPPEVFQYRLGNRSALDWIIDQYQIKTDKRSGIVNDPNRLDDEQYIVRLIGQVITVSLETVKIVDSLPDLGLV